MPPIVEFVASGHEVTAITLDSNIVIFAGKRREYEFRIEQDLVLTIGDAELLVHFKPYEEQYEPPRHIDELVALVRNRIRRASTGADGTLHLTFEGEPVRSIKVPQHQRYEAWTYTHGSYILACPPGGFRYPLLDEPL